MDGAAYTDHNGYSSPSTRGCGRAKEQPDQTETRHQISALTLRTKALQRSFEVSAIKWKESFAGEIHWEAFSELEAANEMTGRLSRS